MLKAEMNNCGVWLLRDERGNIRAIYDSAESLYMNYKGRSNVDLSEVIKFLKEKGVI